MNRTYASVALLVALSGTALATPLGSAFTYQGQLKQNGTPANGQFDLVFRLFDAAAGGNQVGGDANLPNTNVVDGLFTVQLDFGAAAFYGDKRWLEVQVDGVPLSPRQELTAAPYAAFASAPWAMGPGLDIFYTNGRVGIGTTTPAQSLSVAGTVQSTAGGFMFPDGTVQSTAATGGAGLWSSSGANIYNNNAGNVGIGTSSPGMSLEVTTPSYYGKPALGASDGTAYAYLHVSSTASHSLVWDGARDMRFGTESSRGTGYVERMRLAAWGDLAVGNAYTAGRIGADTTVAGQPALWGDSESGPGVEAYSVFDYGVYGNSVLSDAVVGEGYWTTGVRGSSTDSYGVKGESTNNDGIHGLAHSASRSGVWGHNDGGGYGVAGSSASGYAGVWGSGSRNGVYGSTNSAVDSGVFGQNDGGGYGVAGSSASGLAGVYGTSNRNGVHGFTTSAFDSGVWGFNNGSGFGVVGTSSSGEGVRGETFSASSYGGRFLNYGGGVALQVDGRARVGVLEITGADVAEKFPSGDAKVEPGTVMEIDPEHAGQLRVAHEAYSSRVVGVVSGAGDLPVGAVLGNLPGHEDAPPIALSGRVYVNCDASAHAIEPGDLLTTSDVAGHAMKAVDRERSHGAVLGKAMTGLAAGERGLVLVLVNLQ